MMKTNTKPNESGVKLSKTSKMGCKSWSLQAIETCAGSVGDDGNLVEACASCYATQGAYLWPATIAARSYNKEDWKREGWVADMVKALTKERYFRWFDSGDVYSVQLAEKIYQVMEKTPQVNHWLPTRMAKFPKFKAILDKMRALANVSVRFSSDSIFGKFSVENGSTIIPEGAPIPDGVKVCNAPSNDGKCGTCRDCWNKDIPVIGYIAHGNKAKKIIRLSIV